MIDPKKTIGIVIGLFLLTSAFALVFPKETLFFDRLSPEMQVKVIDNQEILFTQVGLAVQTNATRVKVTVQAMPDCPENAPYQTNVLQCFFISTANVEEENITATRISFKVPNDWITANNYSKINMQLRRYSYSWNVNGVLSDWKPVRTVFVKEDEQYAHYTANADGFSYFSIVGIKKQDGEDTVVAPEVDEPIVEEPVIQEPPQAEEPEPIPAVEVKEAIVESPKSTLSSYEWVSIAVVALLSVVLTIMVPRHQPTPEQRSHFDKLTKYIQSAKDKSEDEITKKLQEAGWEDWQITLAINEVKRKN